MLQIDFKPFPLIKTQRLVLRRIRMDDAKDLHYFRSDKKILKYIDKKPEKSLAKTRKFIRLLWKLERKGSAVNWALTVKGNDRLLGNVCLWNIKKDHHRAELGYTLHASLHGKGIMSEAVKAVLETGFKKYKFHSVEANVNPKNKASIKLLKKNKFRKEAHFRENYHYNGKYIDSVIFSKLAP
jgi:ribosomal-protein-alanine N-acetyltransferase